MAHVQHADPDATVWQPYQYSPLPDGSIRLLVLAPSEDPEVPICCRLVEYSLRGPNERPDLFEALSYVWGGSNKPCSISVGSGFSLAITASLHAALLRLRGRTFERVMWIDAVCINQGDLIERAAQVRLMAEVYCRACRVIIWLGEAEGGGSDQALSVIRAAATSEENTRCLDNRTSSTQAILTLLQRPWFQRIWVLQEAAAARQIVVRYGADELDGYAFYLGLRSLQQTSGDDLAGLLNLVRPATYLMSGSIFRPRSYNIRPSGEASLDIRTLGELIDMYHAHQATDRRDKVFALLGMSSDGTSTLDEAGLSPDYTLSWGEVMRRVVKYILGNHVKIDTWDDEEMAVIRGKGYIIGRISSVENAIHSNAGQTVDFVPIHGVASRYTLHALAKPLQRGDLVCQLQGVLRPVVIRWCKGYFCVIMIAGPSLTGDVNIAGNDIAQLGLQTNFWLLWDWRRFGTDCGAPDQEQFPLLTTSRVAGRPHSAIADVLHKISRKWDTGLTWENIWGSQTATSMFQEAVEEYEQAFGHGGQYGQPGGEEFNEGQKWAHEAAKSIRMLAHAMVQRLSDSTDQRALPGNEICVEETITTTGADLLSAVAWMKEEVSEIMTPGKTAENMLKQAIHMRMQAKGPNHPDVLKTKEKLAMKCWSIWPEGKAKELLEEIRGVRTLLQGSEHPDLLSTMERTAEIGPYKGWGNSCAQFNEMIEARTRLHGARRPDTLTSKEKLAYWKVYQAIQQGWHSFIETVDLFKQAIEERMRVQGASHPDVARIVGLFERMVRWNLLPRLHVKELRDIEVLAGWMTYYAILAGQEKISQASLAMVARYESSDRVRRLLEYEGKELRITEPIVEAAAGNQVHGVKVMKLLLDIRGDEIPVTENLLKVVALNSNPSHCAEIARLLVERMGSKIRELITDEVLMTATRNKWVRDSLSGVESPFEVFLNLKGKTRITTDVVRAARESRHEWRLMEYLKGQRGRGVLTMDELAHQMISRYPQVPYYI